MERGNKQQPLVLGGVGLISLGGLVGSAFAPALLVHAPLVLVGLNPTWRHLLLAITVTSLVPFVLVTTVRRSLAAYLAFRVGQLYGDQTLRLIEERSARVGRWVRAFESLFERAGHALLLFVPGLSTATLAGASHLPVRVVMPLIVTGEVVWMTVAFLVGDALKDWIIPLVVLIQQHVLTATIATVVGVLLLSLLRKKKRPSEMLEVDGPSP